MQAAQAAAQQASASERSINEIEAQAYTTAARLERKVALLEKERDMLKGVVASYDAEEANFAGMAKFLVLPHSHMMCTWLKSLQYPASFHLAYGWSACYCSEHVEKMWLLLRSGRSANTSEEAPGGHGGHV